LKLPDSFFGSNAAEDARDITASPKRKSHRGLFRGTRREKCRDCFSDARSKYLIVIIRVSAGRAKARALFLLARKRARGVYQVDFAIDLPACYQREREKERERVRLAEKSAKKYAPEPRDHTRAALKNDRSIDRQEHAVISMHDLLSRLSN